jgi:glycosyltransferase involved in cell wall biosynthesis
MGDKTPLSVVIIVKNEEKRIADCLESVTWADEIIVVDDMSSDKTVEIARRYTDKVFQRKMEIEGIHRNYAYSLAGNEWVLSLDADEKVSPGLRDEIIKVVTQGTDAEVSACRRDSSQKDEIRHCVVFAIPLRNYIGDYWVRWGGWYPAYKDRLFRKGRFRYEEVDVHPRPIYEGRCGRLKGEIIHYSYEDFGELVDSLNGQTSKEAQKWAMTGRKMSLAKALWRAADRFIRSFISKKGYKDGVVGLMVAWNSGLYQILSYAKYWESDAKSKA